ncbi:MAG: 2-oxoglutarate and iron-dependent oxygenase domain-containing protein [Pseudomonadota bacterium]
MEHIPTIDVSGLHSGRLSEFQAVAKKIGEASREIGFFRISGHGISLDLIEDTYQAAARFFALPDAVKREYYIGLSTNHRGYVPFTEKGDYPDEANRSYEAFDLGLDLPSDDVDYLSGNRLLGPNVWPELEGFKQTVSAYYDQISSLGRQICTCLEIFLGLPRGKIARQMDKPISQLRLLHYVRQQHIKDHKSVNMGAHTDYECLTLLHTRNRGLQVMTRDDLWIDVPVEPSFFVVNIGDMLEAWSNGVLRSTPHRVLNLSPERFSLPYFVAANYDTVIRPFNELVDLQNPAKYEPFTAGEHLERMLIRDFPYLRHASLDGIPPSGDPAVMSAVNPFECRLDNGLS